MNFGILPRTELAKFICLIISKSVTTSPGRLFTLILSLQKDVELRSWARYPSMEVFNGLMFLGHFTKLELLPWLGLKTSTLTLGFMWIALLGVRKILSTYAQSHAAPVTISFRDNRVERFLTLLQETLSRCLPDTRDEVLSDDDWLDGDWDLAD